MADTTYSSNYFMDRILKATDNGEQVVLDPPVAVLDPSAEQFVLYGSGDPSFIDGFPFYPIKEVRLYFHASFYKELTLNTVIAYNVPPSDLVSGQALDASTGTEFVLTPLPADMIELPDPPDSVYRFHADGWASDYRGIFLYPSVYPGSNVEKLITAKTIAIGRFQYKYSEFGPAILNGSQSKSAAPAGLSVTLGDTPVYSYPAVNASTQRYANPRKPILLTWFSQLSQPYATQTPIKQVSCQVSHWSAGSSETSVEVGGSTQYEIPAGTYDASARTIGWSVYATDNTGHSAGFADNPEPGASLLLSIYDTVSVSTPTWPANGQIVNPYIENVFTWDFLSNSGEFSPTSTGGAWVRPANLNTWTVFPQTSGEARAVIPKDRLYAGRAYTWGARSYNVDGITDNFWRDNAVTFFTTDTLPTATPQSPVGTNENADATITLAWSWANDSGCAPIEYNIYWGTSADNVSTYLNTHTTDFAGAPTTFDVPAGTFPAGPVFWRVQARNFNLKNGPLSDIVQFTAIGAPAAPTVTVSAVPFATISWASQGQAAYRVTVDGVVYGPFFGDATSLTLSDYLKDGSHTAAVEIQNEFGLWSAPKSVSFTVTNTIPGGSPQTILLKGLFERDAILSWDAASTKDYYIYRDGVQIGHAAMESFVDRFALGAHSYQVIVRLANGNYVPSNVITGTMCSCCPAIALLSGGDWIELRLSDQRAREEEFTWARSVNMRSVLGAEYPVAEASPFADESGAYDVSFSDLSAAQSFEALRGQPVILKSRGGNVMIGILATLSKRTGKFYAAYTFALQRMHWRDFVDVPND